MCVFPLMNFLICICFSVRFFSPIYLFIYLALLCLRVHYIQGMVAYIYIYISIYVAKFLQSIIDPLTSCYMVSIQI